MKNIMKWTVRADEQMTIPLFVRDFVVSRCNFIDSIIIFLD